MAAEWAAHRRSWICWPAREEVWGGPQGLKRAKRCFADVIRAMATFEPVRVAVRPDAAVEAREALAGLANVSVFEVPVDDSWVRDTGPTYLTDGASVRALQWRFNAWGGKYEPFDQDARLATRIAADTGLVCTAVALTCEGGAIHTDGEGTLMATRQTLCNPNRNPTLTGAEIEAQLLSATGTRKMLWLDDGFADEETDGHIDNIAAFVAPGVVLIGVPAYAEASDADAVERAVETLKNARDAAGRALKVIEVEQPAKVRHDWRDRPLNASYLNFVFVNGGIILPAFDDPNDDKAKALFAKIFPSRKIVQVDARPVLEGGGGLHCITLAEPAP
ncbi:MAG: agmatine deiminase family protein [Rhizomicrobium sp.]